MAALVAEREGGQIVEIRAFGTLTTADYDQFVPEIERWMERHGSLRLLFEMVDFHGWTPGALWDDLMLAFRHFHDFERIAMVGDRKWQAWMASFCKPFSGAVIRYFERADIEEARAW